MPRPIFDTLATADELRPYLDMQAYARDTSRTKTRHRIEFKPLPHRLARRAIEERAPCARCGTLMHPIRARKPPPPALLPDAINGTVGGIYYSPTCPQHTSLRCSRGSAAANDYTLMQAEYATQDQEAT